MAWYGMVDGKRRSAPVALLEEASPGRAHMWTIVLLGTNNKCNGRRWLRLTNTTTDSGQ